MEFYKMIIRNCETVPRFEYRRLENREDEIGGNVLGAVQIILEGLGSKT